MVKRRKSAEWGGEAQIANQNHIILQKLQH